MKAKAAFQFLGLVAIGAVLAGCGNVLKVNSGQKISASQAGTNGSALNSSYLDGNDDGAYSCPSKSNVIPKYDWDLNGTGFYQVCANPSDPTLLRIHGEANDDSEICVFPANYVSSQNIKSVIENNQIMVRCAVVNSDAGTDMVFPATAVFNYLFIVRKSDASQMTSCLVSGQSMDCPHYSQGKFR